ncbi:uncharacterized protein PSFLO_06246 [Pseudozyma flocculosa]|uniref:Uncharacterized protein n=1 Tax=Pseudozyma flocculosa TaxID=84751 RepID=A0A5C3F8G8_9BASI|nr:uncharacterized protein PSFLO_06246 [Pseudozyma flocculosa]
MGQYDGTERGRAMRHDPYFGWTDPVSAGRVAVSTSAQANVRGLALLQTPSRRTHGSLPAYLPVTRFSARRAQFFFFALSALSQPSSSQAARTPVGRLGFHRAKERQSRRAEERRKVVIRVLVDPRPSSAPFSQPPPHA